MTHPSYRDDIGRSMVSYTPFPLGYLVVSYPDLGDLIQVELRERETWRSLHSVL